MRASLKVWIYRLGGLFVSLLFVYLAVRQADLSESLRVLETASPALLAAAVLVYLSGLPVRTLRWWRILRSQAPLSRRQVFVPLAVGHMANNVLPARTGEVYRAHFLGRRVGMSRSGVAGSIVVERALDGVMLVFTILAVFFLFPGEGYLGTAALIMGLVFLGLVAGIVVYGLTAARVHRLMDRGVLLLPRRVQGFLKHRVEAFLRGVRGAWEGGGQFEVAAYTLLIWLIEASAIALVVISFGITLPLSGYGLVFALAALSTVIPAGPGYVGPYQYAFVLALGAFAISRETALAVSVAAHLALLGSVTVIGLLLLGREQLLKVRKLPAGGSRGGDGR